MSDNDLKSLNMKVPAPVLVKLAELSDALSINRTAALVMAVNEYHAKHVPPPPKP